MFGDADPLALLDLALAGVAATSLAAAALAHALTPRLAEGEPRPSFLSFCTAAWVLPKIPTRGAAPTSLANLPWSWGAHGFNPDVFVERLGRQWSATRPGTLGAAVVRLMLPAWAAVHAIRGPSLMFALLDAYVISCIAAYMQLAEGDSAVACKIAALLMLKEAGSDLLFCMSWFVLNNSGGNRVTIALQVMLLRKLRALTPDGLARTPGAEMQQLMQDVRRVDDLLWSSPACKVLADALRAAAALGQLAAIYGAAPAGSGAVTALLLFRLQAHCGSMVHRARDRERGASRSRLAVLKELTDSFEALKLYGWTGRYGRSLRDAADVMAAAARQVGLWLAASDLLGAATGDAFPVLALLAPWLGAGGGGAMGVKEFVLGEVYVQILRESVKEIYDAYTKTVELTKVTERIEAFLRLPSRGPRGAGPWSLAKASFVWPELSAGSPQRPVLEDVTFACRPGELVLVSGPTGCGKSSFLLSLLGETTVASGDVTLPDGPVAYQPQVPYLLTGDVRKNILFGVEDQAADEPALQAALRGAWLAVDMDDPDSTLHQRRERTPVGHRGCEISGGQRARTALARLLYAVSRGGVRLALLDDPLAAVDNEIVAAAWHAAVLQAMEGVTRIVAVNSQLLARLAPDADRVVLLDAGRVVFEGPASDLAQDAAARRCLGPAFESLKDCLTSGGHGEDPVPLSRPNGMAKVAASDREGNQQEQKDVQQAVKHALEVTACSPTSASDHLVRFLKATPGTRCFLNGGGSAAGAQWPPLAAGEWAEFRRLLAACQEQPDRGPDAASSSALSVFASFFRRMLFWTAGSMLASFMAEAMLPVAMAFLAAWRSGELAYPEWACSLILAALLLAKSLLGSGGMLLRQLGLAQTALSLRSAIDETLLRLSMPYFWSGGRIADVRTVVTTDLNDFEALSSVPIGLAQNLFGLLAVLWAVPGALPLVLLAALAWRRVAFPKTWVFTQVIPMFSKQIYPNPTTLAAEEYDSVIPMRALQVEALFDGRAQRTAMHLVHGRMLLWGGMLLKDVLSLPIKALFVLCAMGCVVHVKQRGGSAAQALVLFNIAWGLVKKINDFNWKLDKGIERLVQYRGIEELINTRHVEDLAAGEAPPAPWPEAGRLSFRNVCFRYAPGRPLALRDVSLEVAAGEKLGIVGPTGTGKSTFLRLLFRLGPCTSGSVLLDGLDIARLPLSALRAAVGVVPQEATIFRGSVRANVTGTAVSGGAGEDACVLAALTACGLSAVLAAPGAGAAAALDAELPELSVGQRQLLAAARAVARRPHVLVLDEATASLSQEAAEHLVSVLHDHCGHATMLSVTHRLRFALRCDRILVLAHGGHLEALGSPTALRASHREGGGGSEYLARQLREEAA